MIALMDCNNFFVSCELTQRPQLRGRAVVVGGHGDSNGIAAAMSNEAKRLGVTRGMPIFRLKPLVDSGQLVVLPGDHNLYKRISDRVMSVIEQLDVPVEVYSIDEAFMHLDMLPENAAEFCRHVRRLVMERTGIPVSIGISHTKTLCKAAARFAKRYDGYGGVCLMETPQKIRKGLELTAIEDVWGIGRRLAARISAAGARTAADFADMARSRVNGMFPLPVQCTWLELNGKACLGADSHTRRHLTCRCTRTFDRDIESAGALESHMAGFCSEVARSLRRHSRLACEMEIFIATNPYKVYAPQRTGTATVRLTEPTADTCALISAMHAAFATAYLPGFTYKRAGVCVTRTVGLYEHTESLFADHSALRRREHLMNTIDSLHSGGIDVEVALAMTPPML